MPYIRTDDGPRRLRAVWLGPKGARWYWTWTYTQWAATVVAVAAGATAMLGVIWLLAGDLKVAVIIGPLWGGTLGVFATKAAMRHVDHDRPVRYWRAVLKGEWRGSTSVSRTQTETRWWVEPVEPKTMSRYALAYLGLNPTVPARVRRPAEPFPHGVVREASHDGQGWTLPLDRIPDTWPQPNPMPSTRSRVHTEVGA